jgi:hypothetical protein
MYFTIFSIFTTQISYDPTLFRHQNNFLVKIFFLLDNLRKQSPPRVPLIRRRCFLNCLRNVPENYRLDEICLAVIF